MKLSRAVMLSAALVLVPTAALAYQEVEVNGQVWACQNRCVVTTMPNGGFMIRDSLGGHIYLLNPR